MEILKKVDELDERKDTIEIVIQEVLLAIRDMRWYADELLETIRDAKKVLKISDNP